MVELGRFGLGYRRCGLDEEFGGVFCLGVGMELLSRVE